jgi:hypothetical protein
MMRSTSLRSLILGTLLVAFAGCSDAGPSTPLLYRMGVYEHYTYAPISSAHRGDSVWIMLSIEDSTTPGGTSVTIRDTCARLATILRGGAVVDSVPISITCAPTSTKEQVVGTRPQFVSIFTLWPIPASFPAGTYTIRGEVLVNPRVNASVTLPVL